MKKLLLTILFLLIFAVNASCLEIVIPEGADPQPEGATQSGIDKDARIEELEKQVEALTRENELLRELLLRLFGDTEASEDSGASAMTRALPSGRIPGSEGYVLNTNRMKIHLMDGPDTHTIKEEHIRYSNQSLAALYEEGYTVCQRCFPKDPFSIYY